MDARYDVQGSLTRSSRVGPAAFCEEKETDEELSGVDSVIDGMDDPRDQVLSRTQHRRESEIFLIFGYVYLLRYAHIYSKKLKASCVCEDSSMDVRLSID